MLPPHGEVGGDQRGVPFALIPTSGAHLLPSSQLSLTAAQCARTLIGAAASGNVLLRLCAKLLMPGLIEFVAKMAPAVNDRTISDLHSAAIAETWKAFNTFFTSVPDEHST